MILEQIRLRKIDTTEVDLLKDLTTSTFHESWLEDGNENDLESYIHENFSTNVLLAELKSNLITYIVAEVQNKIVAYIKIERDIQPYEFIVHKPICISRLYVKKGYQRLSIGSTLISEALLISANESYKVIWLGVWNKNLKAIQLYERHGFSKFGMYQFVMGNDISDDFLMKRKV